MIETINPATGQLIKTYDVLTSSELTATLEQMDTAYSSWRKTKLAERIACVHRLTELLTERKQSLATAITQEMGKPIVQATREIDRCIACCQYFLEHAKDYLQSRTINATSYVCYESIGIIFAIMPWNFPLLQVIKSAIPAMLLGNGYLLKPAPITTGCNLLLKQVFRDAGFPEGVFNIALIEEAQVEALIMQPQIKGVAFTGSIETGRIIAGYSAAYVKPTVLELGGCDPCCVLEDADLDLAAEKSVFSRLNNAGQVCVSAKRIIVEKSVREPLLERIMQQIKAYSLGDPMNETTRMGPLARADLRLKVHAQVLKSVQLGAELLIGGDIPQGDGYYYPVTVLDQVVHGMPAYDTEIFGPVISLITAEDETDVIRIANDTQYGLGATVFTRDRERGERMVRQLDAGVCYVNDIVSSHPSMPFGGTKQSGYGRELSMEGFHAFANIKSVCIN